MGRQDVLHTNKTSILSPVLDSSKFPPHAAQWHISPSPSCPGGHLTMTTMHKPLYFPHLIKPIIIQWQPFSGPHCSLFNHLHNLLLLNFHWFYYYTNTPSSAWPASQYHHWPPVVMVANEWW